MPSNVVKSYAKKSGNSVPEVEKNWEEAKKLADKKFGGKKTNAYWSYVNSITQRKSGLSEDMSSSPLDIEVRQGLEDTLRAKGADNANQLAQSSIDLAQNKIPDEVDKGSQDYATMLSGLASNYAGTSQSVAGNPVTPSQNKSIMGNTMFPAHESYKSIEQIYEDNYYQHNSVVVSNSGSDVSYEGNKDKFDFSLSSNSGRAVAIAIENGASFEVKFQILTSSSSMWPSTWRSLEKENNIQSVLKLTVNQLTMDSQYMRADDSKNISSSYYASLYKTISNIMKAYIKLWGKSHFQCVVLTTNKGEKVQFIDGLAKELSSISGLKVDDSLSAKLHTLSPVGGNTYYYIAIKNSSGKPIKEEVVEEEVSSDAFMGAVPENATVFGQLGKDINDQSRRNVAKMKKKGLSAQLEAEEDTLAYKMKNKIGNRLPTAPSVTHQKANRMYYVQYKDGTVEAFDSSEARDAALDANDESTVIRASDYFNAIMDHSDSIWKDDDFMTIDDESFAVDAEQE